MEATPEITQSSTALATVERLTPMQLFAPGTIQPLLDRLKAEVRAIDTDISTEKGRKEISSLSYRIARTKTFIDEQRTKLVADEKRRLSAIDQEGRRIRQELDDLKDAVRAPLTAWENKERSRIAEHERRIAAMNEVALKLSDKSTTADIEALMAQIAELANHDFEEFAKRAAATRSTALSRLGTDLALSREADAMRAELDRMAREANEKARQEREKARQEREDQIASEAAAAERSRAEAEAREREEALTRAAEVERQRLEREREEAEERARRAEAARVEGERQAARDAEQAARDAEQAAAQATRDKEAAIAADRRRQAAAQKAKEDQENRERAARERDRAHRAEINRRAGAALVAGGIDPAVAKIVIELIARKIIPNISISY